jgi:uncharacterized protein YbjT (DUF2867 family)
MSSPTPSKILLFGATGVIGKYILEQLIEANPAFEKIGIFTSPGTVEKKSEDLEKLKEKGVEVVVGDVNSESDVKKAFEGTYPVQSINVEVDQPRITFGNRAPWIDVRRHVNF